MATYYGVVKDNRIVLPEGVRLEEGTSVEVRIFTDNASAQNSNVRSSQDSVSEASAKPSAEREEEFMQKLLEEGLIKEIKKPPKASPTGDRILVNVKGKPMSQTIVEDRR